MTLGFLFNESKLLDVCLRQIRDVQVLVKNLFDVIVEVRSDRDTEWGVLWGLVRALRPNLYRRGYNRTPILFDF